MSTPAPAASNTADGSTAAIYQDFLDGKAGARNALLFRLRDNLTRLTAAILRQFPIIQREADSVYQQLNQKLIEGMDAGAKPKDGTKPEVASFIRFAANRLRQLLIDEADKLRRRGFTKRFADPGQSSAGGAPPPTAEEDSISVLLQWEEFQQKVQELDDNERLVFDLCFHLNYKQSEVAEVLAMSPKAVSRTWLEVADRLKDSIPKLEAPTTVLLVSGGTDFTSGAVRTLFAGWPAVRMKVHGNAETGSPIPTASVEWATVVAVTRPEYAELARRNPAIGTRKVVCLDVPDQFDPADKKQVDLLWQRLMKRIGE